MTSAEAAWTTILDELEGEVSATERLCDDPALYHVGAACAWRAPQDMAPLPANLAKRAAQILERQLAAVTRLRGAMAAVNSQRDRAHMRRSSVTHPDVPPIYVDTRA